MYISTNQKALLSLMEQRSGIDKELAGKIKDVLDESESVFMCTDLVSKDGVPFLADDMTGSDLTDDSRICLNVILDRRTGSCESVWGIGLEKCDVPCFGGMRIYYVRDDDGRVYCCSFFDIDDDIVRLAEIAFVGEPFDISNVRDESR